MFNGLKPAEHEHLALLLGELGEAQQVIGKILRHGYEQRNPLDPASPVNRELLQKELGHVEHAVERMCGSGDLAANAIVRERNKKADSVRKWLHHQKDAL